MYVCTLCKFTVEADDVRLHIEHHPDGNCVCLRCYERETDTTPTVGKFLRKELSEALNASQGAWPV